MPRWRNQSTSNSFHFLIFFKFYLTVSLWFITFSFSYNPTHWLKQPQGPSYYSMSLLWSSLPWVPSTITFLFLFLPLFLQVFVRLASSQQSGHTQLNCHPLREASLTTDPPNIQHITVFNFLQSIYHYQKCPCLELYFLSSPTVV